MNKTVQIHIKGVPFTMEEEAYRLLNNYLLRLKKSLGNQEGAEDIIEDIELRIAELLNEQTKKGTLVIEERHVTEVLATLGDPKDYTHADYNEEQPISEETFAEIPSGRSLFRDLDNAWIAGVCSGMSAYLNINVMLIRLALVLFVILGGSGFIIYLVLWIVMPKPKTTLDRLRMQGKPINVESIKEEVNFAASQFEKSTTRLAEQLKDNERIDKITKAIVKIIRVFVGLILLGIAVSLILGFTALLFSDQAIIKNNSQTIITSLGMSDLLFENLFVKNLAWFSVYALGGSVLFSLLIGALILLFSLKPKIWKYTMIAMTIFGITGLITAAYVTFDTLKEFRDEVEIEEEIFSSNEEQLIINMNLSEKLENGRTVKKKKGSRFLEIDGKQIISSGYDVRFTESPDSLYHLFLVRKAHGRNNLKAQEKANNIQFSIQKEDNNIKLNTYYAYPQKDKFRDQEIEIHVRIPKNKSVQFDKKTVNFLPKQMEESEQTIPTQLIGVVSEKGEYIHFSDY